ncbi:MAG: protein kinase domain-containing protein [Gemmatimonas sp.]
MNSPSAEQPEPVVLMPARYRTWADRWVAVSERPQTSQGQGTVWRVRDRREEHVRGPRSVYALKEMRYTKGPESTAFRRFVREIETTQRLAETHAGIVRVVDAHLGGPDGDTVRPYYVMPWAESTLASIRGLATASSLERVLEIGTAIADALISCHEATPPVIHRDVKPANVLLAGDALVPQLADFGICFLADDERARVTNTAAHTVGSEGFTAPELLGGGRIESVGPTADVYSLGKTLYAVLAGGEPFPREFHRDPRYDLAARFGDPRLEHLHGLLDHMVDEDPHRRYPTMRECRDRLQQAVDNLRRGVFYVPGLYGGGESPRQRYTGLQAALALSPGVRRTDALHDATQRSLDSALARAQQFVAEGHDVGDSGATPSATVTTACADIADHFMAVGIPVVRAGEQEELEHWIDETSAVTVRPRGEPTTAQALIAAGAVLAVYGVAAAAWVLPRRESLLGVLVGRFASANRRWIHLTALGNHSGHVLPIAQEMIAKSPLMTLELRTTPDRLVDTFSIFPALAALVSLASLDDDSLQQFVTDPRAQELPQYPCFDVRGAGWVPTFAAACLQSAARERAIARGVFNLDAAELRAFCSHVRKGISRVLVQRNPDRSLEWNFDVDPQGTWKTWLGSPR